MASPRQDVARVRRLIEFAKPPYADWGRIMQAVLGAYARGEYDLTADPNALILEAERVAVSDPEAALRIVGRAGAMGLRGKRWRWRWEDELEQPLAHWVALAHKLIEDNAPEPLAPFEQERDQWHAVAQETIQHHGEESQIAEPREEQAQDELDKLLEKLYKGARALTPTLEKAIAARRDDAIPRLLELAEQAILDTVRYTHNRDLKSDLASILGKVGRSHPATFDALVGAYNDLSWDEGRVCAAWSFGDLGDSRAIPILEKALRTYWITELDRIEIENALAQLAAKPETSRLEVDPLLPRRSGESGVLLQRTAPCWCGSGKQYKRCHMQEDLKHVKKKRRRKK